MRENVEEQGIDTAHTAAPPANIGESEDKIETAPDQKIGAANSSAFVVNDYSDFMDDDDDEDEFDESPRNDVTGFSSEKKSNEADESADVHSDSTDNQKDNNHDKMNEQQSATSKQEIKDNDKASFANTAPKNKKKDKRRKKKRQPVIDEPLSAYELERQSKSSRTKKALLDEMLDESIASATTNLYRVSAHVYRIAWIDIAKCLAVLFIVISQTASMMVADDPVAGFVSSFGLAFAFPLLFVMSGYTTYKEDFSPRYVLTMAHKYLLPYAFAGFLYIVFSMILTDNRNVLEWVCTFIYGSASPMEFMMFPENLVGYSMGFLWILPTLFVGRLMAYLLSYIPLLTRLVIAGGLFIIGSSTVSGLFLPCDIQPALCALWYMTCGMILRDKDIFSTYGWEKILIALCATLGVGYVLMMTFSGLPLPDYSHARYYQSAIDMIGTVCAAMVAMSVAQLLSELGMSLEGSMEWLGRNLVSIIAWLGVISVIAPVIDNALSELYAYGLPPNVVVAIVSALLCTIVVSLAYISYMIKPLKWILVVDEKPSKRLLSQGTSQFDIISDYREAMSESKSVTSK